MTRIVDAHLHVWDLADGEYSWLTPEHGALYASFGPEEAYAALRAAGVDAAVLVQAEDSLAETRRLLRVAHDNAWVAGVVGWIPLDDPEAADRALHADGDRLCGVRHLVHDDPRDDFLELPTVRDSLGLVAERGLAFDVPDAWPRSLASAERLARAQPGLTVVIDHLAKPPAGREDFGEWRCAFAVIAALPNVVAKFSGLHLPGVAFGVDTVAPLLDVALEAFGAERLMYGGDWPVSVPHGGYGPTWEVMRACVETLAPAERAAILGGTAERVYAHDPGPREEAATC